jgi:Domain of unknown function (DUF4129)
VSPEEIRQTADEILERSEFDEPEPNLLERITGWIDDRIHDVVGFIGRSGIFQVIAVLVLLVGLALLVRWLWGREWSGRRRHPHDGVSIDEVRRRSPADWRAEADEREGRGEWKLALRCRYRALVGDLLAERLVDDVAGRTTGELRADVVARAPERAEAFSAASDLFDLAWYADRPTGPEESARFQALALTVTGARR